MRERKGFVCSGCREFGKMSCAKHAPKWLKDMLPAWHKKKLPQLAGKVRRIRVW